MTTASKQKMVILVTDGQKPGVLEGDYVRVAKDSTSPGMNQLEGYGFLKKVEGVGAAMITTVKYDKAFGGVSHSKIPFPTLTVAVFGQDWECEDHEISL
jgi:hypothetical protein